MAKKLTEKKTNGAAKKAGKQTAKKKKELTADELLLRAWQKTYENRHKRLDV